MLKECLICFKNTTIKYKSTMVKNKSDIDICSKNPSTNLYMLLADCMVKYKSVIDIASKPIHKWSLLPISFKSITGS